MDIFLVFYMSSAGIDIYNYIPVKMDKHHVPLMQPPQFAVDLRSHFILLTSTEPNETMTIRRWE